MHIKILLKENNMQNCLHPQGIQSDYEGFLLKSNALA